MGACNVHRVEEPGCLDCVQDQRDCLRDEVNRLRGTLQIASLEPAGELCVRCSWLDGKVLKQCWPCKRIGKLELQVEAMRPVVEAAINLVRFLPQSVEFADAGQVLCQTINTYTEKRKDEGCICPAVDGEIHTEACPANKWRRRS